MARTIDSSALQAWWGGRSRREQMLVALMGLSLAGFLLWFGLVSPLASAAEAAEARRAQAVQDKLAVDRTLAAIARLGPAAARPISSRPLGALVSETAAAAGVELARVEADPAGGVRVAVAGASPTVLFPWLATLQREHGVAPRHLTVLKAEGGGLALDATLDRGAR